MDPLLVIPEVVNSAPYCLRAFGAGFGIPVSLWGVVFIVKFVRRGYRVGGGIGVSE